MSNWLVSIDSGGTFTDVVAHDVECKDTIVTKVPSVPSDPSVAAVNGVDRLIEMGVDPARISHVVHGTTVATNAVLEGRGARAGLLLTRGFRAVYEARIGSDPESLSDLVDPFFTKPPLLIPQRMTFEIPERISANGEILEVLDESAVRLAVEQLLDLGVESIAVCYLFAFVNDSHERETERIVSEVAPGVRLSLSSKVLPTIREYPRLSTTVVDAYVGPIVESYLDRLACQLATKGVTTPQVYLALSNGGLTRLDRAAQNAAHTLLSGPAGGMVAGARIADLYGESNIVTLDMGGTSSDFSVIVDGRLEETTAGSVSGQDIALPMLRVRTLGAGGGSIARINRSGLLEVGPQSAGALPGPACYATGGTEPTVTDANLLLGVLGSDSLLGGRFPLDRPAAWTALSSIAQPMGVSPLEAAAGVLRIVNNEMAVSIRLALSEQGQDPRRFALVAFGGAGPSHAAVVAAMVGLPRVIVPPHPGLNSAMGLLQTDVRHTYVRSHPGSLDSFAAERMNLVFDQLEELARSEMRSEGFSDDRIAVDRQLDLRYSHQGYELTIDVPHRPVQDTDKQVLCRDFGLLHEAVYGQHGSADAVEVVTFRVNSHVAVPHATFAPLPSRASGTVDEAIRIERDLYDVHAGGFAMTPVYDRALLAAGDVIHGPAVVEQFDSTTVVPTGMVCAVDAYGMLVIGTGA